MLVSHILSSDILGCLPLVNWQFDSWSCPWSIGISIVRRPLLWLRGACSSLVSFRLPPFNNSLARFQSVWIHIKLDHWFLNTVLVIYANQFSLLLTPDSLSLSLFRKPFSQDFVIAREVFFLLALGIWHWFYIGFFLTWCRKGKWHLSIALSAFSRVFLVVVTLLQVVSSYYWL